MNTGYSKAYGAEFYVSKNRGRLTGWISYTLSHARNYIAALEDKEYPPVYDRPHSLKIFLNYEAGRKRRCAFAATFSYNSGMNLTLPIAHYRVNGTAFYIYSTRNGYRAPAFHELNLSMTCKTGKRGRLILSVMNVYNRKMCLLSIRVEMTMISLILACIKCICMVHCHLSLINLHSS